MKAQSELMGDHKSYTEMMQPSQLRCNNVCTVMNNDTIASSLRLWGKQFLDSLLKIIIELLAVYLVNQFKKMITKMRKHKSTIKRIIKIMALFLSIGLMCLYLVSDQMLISSNDNVATIVVVETNHCSADKEEVFSCPPVQRCTENNSVNSAKICLMVRPLTTSRRSNHIQKSKSQEELYEENELTTKKRKIPLEQRAHFYTGASPVSALCEANSPDT